MFMNFTILINLVCGKDELAMLMNLAVKNVDNVYQYDGGQCIHPYCRNLLLLVPYPVAFFCIRNIT